MAERLPCCATWDDNQVIAQTVSMRAVRDGYPVRPGHALVYPRRHVDRLADLWVGEMQDLLHLVAHVQRLSQAEDFFVFVNDGSRAGRRVPHLHMHVVPIFEENPLPPGGGRGLFVPVAEDPWIVSRG